MKKRIIIIICAFLIVLFTGAYIFVRSSFFTERLRSFMESTLEKQLDREVSVGEVSGNIISGLSIDGISVANGEDFDEGKLLDIRKLDAGYSLLGLLRWRFVIRNIRVSSPRIWLEMDEEGKLNIPELAQAEAEDEGESRFSVLISNIEILSGEVMFKDKRNPIQADINGINGRLRRTGGEMDYFGEIRAQSMEINARGISKTLTEITASFETSDWGANVSDFQMRLDNSHLQATAEVFTDEPVLVSAEIQSKLFLRDIEDFLAAPGGEEPPPELDGIAEIYVVVNGKMPNIGGACVVSAPAIGVNDLEARNVDAEVKFTEDTIDLTYLSVDLTEGGAKLSGSVKLLDGEVDKYRASLEMDNLDLGRIMTGISRTEAPLSGQLSGEVLVYGRELRPDTVNVVGNLSMLDTKWKDQKSPTNIGAVKTSFSVEDGTAELNVYRDGTSIVARGVLSDDASLNVTANSDIGDLRELVSLVTAPSPISGSGRVDAEISMKIADPKFRELMELPPIDSTFSLAEGIADLQVQASINVPDLRVAIEDGQKMTNAGSLTGKIDMVDDHISTDDLKLRLGQSELDMIASATIKEDGKHEIDAELNINSLRIENYASLISDQSQDDSMKISGGLVNGSLEVEGNTSDISGGGEISIADMSIATTSGEYNIENIAIPVKIRSNVLNIPDLVISGLGGQITASCRLTPSGEYDLQIDSTPIKLSNLPLENGAVNGTIQMSLCGAGNINSPLLHGKLELLDFKYDKEDFGDGQLEFNLKDEKVHVDASLSDQSFIVALDGSIEHPFPYSAIVQLGNINLRPALNLAGLQENSNLRIAGSIDVDGEFANPLNTSVYAMFQTVIFDIATASERYIWRNDGAIDLQFIDGKLQVNSLKMKGSGGGLSVSGDVDIDGAVNLEANVENLDLMAVSKLSESPSPIAGKLDCRLNLSDNLSSPIAQFDLKISEMYYEQIDLDEISLIAHYSRGMVEVTESTVKTFGGQANVKAILPLELDLRNPPTMDQLMESSVFASLRGGGMDLGFIPSVAPEVLKAGGNIDSIDLQITGLLRRPMVNGSVKLKSGNFQLEALPIVLDNVRGSLSLVSREGDGGSIEYEASTDMAWSIGEGRYSARLLVSGLGNRIMNTWDQTLGIETPESDEVLPSFQLDAEIDEGQLDEFMKALQSENLPPISGHFSGEVHIGGEIGEWVSEPIEPFSVVNLPLRGNAVISSLNLAVEEHKIKNSGDIKVSLMDDALKISEANFLTLPPPMDYASAANAPPVQFGSATFSGSINEDKTFRLDVVGERIHPGLFSSLANSEDIESGKLNFEVKAMGNPESPTISISATATEVKLPVPAIAGTPNIDNLVFKAYYEDNVFNIDELSISSFDNQLVVDGTIPISLSLTPVAVNPLDNDLNMAFMMDNFQLSFLNYFTDRVKEVKGQIDADVRVLGTLKNPHLDGSFKLADAEFQLLVNGTPPAQDEESTKPQYIDVKDINLNIAMGKDDMVIGEVSLGIGEGSYKANGKVEMGKGLIPQNFDVTFETSPAKIDPFVKLAGSDQVSRFSGEIVANGHLRGDIQDFRSKPILDILRTVSGEIQIPASGVKLDIAEHRIGNPKRIYAKLENGILDLSSFKLIDETASNGRASSIAAFGSWKIDGEKSFDATVNLDSSLIPEILNQDRRISGWLTLKLEGRQDEIRCFWPLPSASDEQKLTFEYATLDRFEGNLLYKNQELNVKQVRISSGKNHIIFSGSVPMTGQNMDLKLDARLNDMGILSFINRDITESSGSGVMGATIAGDIKKIMMQKGPLQFAGFCRFSNLNVNFYEANINFEGIEADVAFDFGRAKPERGAIKLNSLRGKMNGGDFILRTDKSPEAGIEILWSRESGYKMGALRDMPVAMTNCTLYEPMAYNILFRGELILKGQFDAPVVSGDITIVEGEYTESLEGFVQRLFSSREIGFKAFLDYPLVQDLELDVNVTVPGDMFMINSLVNAEAKAFARVSGSLAEPMVEAQGQVIEGVISYFGREFRIIEGEISNSAEINPEYKIKAEVQLDDTEDIDIEAAQGTDLTVQMELNGSLSSPQPPDFAVSGSGVAQEGQLDMSDTDIISILTLGSTPGTFIEKGISGSSPLLMESAKWYAEKRVEKWLDLKDFEIQLDPNESKETRLLVAKEIMKQISLLVDVGYSGQQWIGLQREMGSNFAFDGKVSQYGDWSFDLKIKKDFP